MTYRFGPFALDASARELTSHGERVDTEPKAFELLLYLAEHRSRAVSKDELLSVLWPRQIVTETALSRCVMKARRAVGDDADRQSVIRTVHGHGYRFVADVGEASVAEAPELHQAGTRPPRRRAGTLAVLALSVALLAGIAWLAWENAGMEPAGTIAVLPVADRTGDPDLGWVRAGMMSLMSRMLEDNGLDVVTDREVLDAAGLLALEIPPDGATFQQVRLQTGASTVLHTTLDFQGGLHRLVAVLTRADGRHTRRIIVGDSPAELAADLAEVIAQVLQGEASPDVSRYAKVSSDPFVNELYARALDLELQGQLEEARDLFRLASAQEPELFWLRYEIALCTRDLREWDEAAALFAALYEDAYAGNNARARIVTTNSRGVMHLMRNDYAAAEMDFGQALEVATERGQPDERATVLVNLGLINTRLGRLADAIGYYERALHEFAATGRPPSGLLLNNYAGLLLESGNLDDARALSERAIESFRLHGQRRFEAPALNRLGKILRRQGDLDGALARHEQALTIYRDLGNVVGEVGVLDALTSVYRAKGDLTRARHNAADVLSRALEVDDDLLLGDAYIQSAYVESDFGRHRPAIEYFQAADRIFTGIGDAAGMRAARSGIALSAMRAGDLDLASSLANDLLQSAIADGNDTADANARWLLGRIAEASGQLSAAAEAYGVALAYARSSGDRDVLTTAALSLATLHLSAGDLEDAALLVEELRPAAANELEFLRLDARLAHAQGRNQQALDIVSILRNRAGEAWNQDDDELLAQLSR